MDNKKFCPIPWVHLQVEPNGMVRPCCITQSGDDSKIGNINDTPLEELWNAPRMMELRKNILSGEGDSICDVCYKYDDAGLPSFRSNATKNLARRCTNLESAIANTDADGRSAEINLEYWDFRFSNMCNFKCRSCGPGYSNSWYGDAAKMGWVNEVPAGRKLITWLNKVDDRIAVLEKHIHTVKEIYFAGGEPLIMDEHFRALDLLIKHGRTDIKIRYNTNMSSLKYKGKDLIDDYWSHFGDVEISGSLDAVGRQAEYIRSGTKWEVLDQNIRRLHEASKSGRLKLMFNVTISNMNIFYLEDILNYFREVGIVKPFNTYDSRPWQFFFNLVFSPEHMCIQHMPNSAKAEVRELFNAFDQKLKDEHGVNYSMFTDLYPILDAPSDVNRMLEFNWRTKELDGVRNESVAEALPRLWKHYNPIIA